MSDKNATPIADPQLPDDDLKLDKPMSKAAGTGALIQVAKYVHKDLGWKKGLLLLNNLNQKDGFDCPGCAWPEPDQHRSKAEFCENGAKAVAEEAMVRSIGQEFFAQYSVAELSEKSDYWLSQQGRLAEPMVKQPGQSHYQPIGWQDAYQLIASNLKNVESSDESVFYASGRASNEAAFLYQLLARQYGTNNLPDSSNLCHESSGIALKETIGIGKGVVSLEDFDAAECILVVGQNPGTNHPRMLGALSRAAERGCKIISINPLKEAGLKAFQHPKNPMHLLGGSTKICSHFVQVKINGDVALFQGIAKAIFELAAHDGKGIDSGFIESKTEGFEAYKQHILDANWDDIETQSGIAISQIKAVAEVIRSAKSVIACWAMGLTQQVNAVANIQEIVNTLLIGGNIGRKGAGVCPVRGHSNVQGDRTMGVTCHPLPQFMNALESEFKFSPPSNPGLDAINAIRGMSNGDVKNFIALGGNFLSACPDTHFTADALSKCQLTVQISTKLNRSHLCTGETALLLPCFGRSDIDVQNGKVQWVTTENSMGYISKSQGVVEPVSKQIQSEVAIICGIGKALFETTPDSIWEKGLQNYSAIRDLIEKVVPGFEGFNTRIKANMGFSLPNPIRERCEFLTASKKAQFTCHDIPNYQRSAGQYRLMTIRSHDQFNSTIYGLNDRYRGVYNGRRVIFMNEQDMRDEGLSKQMLVDITSHHQGESRKVCGFAVVPYDIPVGCTAAYYPETNAIVPLALVAAKSNTPASKMIDITLSKSMKI